MEENEVEIHTLKNLHFRVKVDLDESSLKSLRPCMRNTEAS